MRNRVLAAAALAWLLAGCGPKVKEELPELEPPRMVSIDETGVVDLTHPFDSTAVICPAASRSLGLPPNPAGRSEAGNRFAASEHGGTHMDAPIRFAEGGWTSDEIPVERLLGPAAVIDVSDSAGVNPDYRLRVEDVLQWEAMNGRIPDGAIVLMRTGWGKKWPEKREVFGTDTPDSVETLHFPGFSEAVARFLTTERSVDAVGLDTPSLDYGQSRDFAAHRIFAEAGVPGFENVADLRLVPETGAWVIALPMKIAGGTGGPLRIIALLP